MSPPRPNRWTPHPRRVPHPGRPGSSALARLLSAGALLLSLALVAGCGGQRKVGPASETGEFPDQEVSDFVLTETDQGKPQWTLYARYAATYSARNTIVARAIRVDFFDEQGKRSSELTAREGEIDQLSRNMTARGNVLLQTTEGTRMSTEQLQFLNRRQKIVSDRLVRVERGDDVLTGTGFESDPNLRHFEFKSQVKATVRTRNGEVVAPTPGGR